jgi:Putative diphthamide synthesis protein
MSPVVSPEMPSQPGNSLEPSQDVVKTARTPKTFTFQKNKIPLEILENSDLQQDIQQLPSNYEFEIYKSVFQIKKNNAKKVALQFPEGLLMYSLAIADIFERFCGVETLVMGDVTYGACCIDDFTARSVGCDMMIHYGHSCLVPVDVTSIKTLYVFVDISIDLTHFIETVRKNIDFGKKIALLATIQFVTSLQVPHYTYHRRPWMNYQKIILYLFHKVNRYLEAKYWDVLHQDLMIMICLYILEMVAFILKL